MEALSKHVVELGFGPATEAPSLTQPLHCTTLDFKLSAVSQQGITGAALARSGDGGSNVASERNVN